MIPQDLPDLVARARAWLDEPQPVRGVYDAARIGRGLLRQLEQSGPPGGASALRGSQVGDCRRAIAYRVAGTPSAGRGVDGVARMTWAIGDAVEAMLSIALEESLPEGWAIRHTRDEQHHGAWEFDGLRVPVHADGLGRMADGTGFTVEIKSAAGYKLDSWRRTGWDRSTSYRWQVHAAQAAYRVRWTYVAAVDKGAATLWGQWIEWDDDVDTIARGHLLAAAKGRPEETPRVLPDGTALEPTEPAKSEKDRRRVLPWQCRYCAFWRTCWPTAEEGWTSRGKPTLRVPDEVPAEPAEVSP